jgi:serine/threonine protein kinase
LLFSERKAESDDAIFLLVHHAKAHAKPPQTMADQYTPWNECRELGQGEFGIVRAAFRKHDGVEVALKRFKQRREDKEIGVHFSAIREIRVMRETCHPNIVQLYDVGFISSSCFFCYYSNLLVVMFFFRIILLSRFIDHYNNKRCSSLKVHL